MRILSSLLVAAAVVAFAGAALAQQTITLVSHEENNSGETGFFSIVPNGNGITVRLSVVGEPAGGNQPAHIHTGTCANLGGVYKPLKNVVDGQSVTDISGLTIDDLERGTYAINVHKGPGPLISTYVTCADLSNTGMKM
jgi:hypothetical protein